MLCLLKVNTMIIILWDWYSNENSKDFFLVDGVTLAKKLLGKILVRKIDGKIIKARIVETEAYMGPLDKAAHSYQNRRTKRTEPMFLEGGHIYIYFIYGMYYCFNITANTKDIPEAVLIRAVEPLENKEYMKELRGVKKIEISLMVLVN